MKNQILTFLYYTSSYIALPKINTNSFYMLFVHKKKKIFIMIVYCVESDSSDDYDGILK